MEKVTKKFQAQNTNIYFHFSCKYAHNLIKWVDLRSNPVFSCRTDTAILTTVLCTLLSFEILSKWNGQDNLRKISPLTCKITAYFISPRTSQQAPTDNAHKQNNNNNHKKTSERNHVKIDKEADWPSRKNM